MNKSSIGNILFMVLAALSLGALAYSVAIFYMPGNLPATVGSGILAALVTIVALRLSLGADGTRQVPASRPEPKPLDREAGKLSLVDEVGSKQGHSPTPAAGNTRKPQVSRPEPKPFMFMQKLMTDSGGEGQVSYTTEKLGDGSVKVIVTAQGLSGRQFKGANGLRDRVAHIKGVKYTADNNPTEKKRTLTATVKPGPQQATVLAGLAKLLGKPSSSK